MRREFYKEILKKTFGHSKKHKDKKILDAAFIYMCGIKIEYKKKDKRDINILEMISDDNKFLITTLTGIEIEDRMEDKMRKQLE
mmetsp:Transcript_7795/g.6892  ORF Transcript_7795/g.6892 Transcript_7795/m.6892 type:complete len:84 (+) Transcript_7795:83-334(+)